MLTEHDQFQACREAQEYFDKYLRDLGTTVQPSSPGQTQVDYIRGTCDAVSARHLPPDHQYRRVKWGKLDADALPPLVPQLMKACKDESTNPRAVPAGELRAVKVHSEYSDRPILHWIGSWNERSGSEDSFVKDPAYGHRPGRRITSWMTDKGFLFPNGHPIPVAQTLLPSGRVQAA